MPRSAEENGVLANACGYNSSCFFGIAAVAPDDQGFLTSHHQGEWYDVSDWSRKRAVTDTDYANWCSGEPEDIDISRRSGEEREEHVGNCPPGLKRCGLYPRISHRRPTLESHDSRLLARRHERVGHRVLARYWMGHF